MDINKQRDAFRAYHLIYWKYAIGRLIDFLPKQRRVPDQIDLLIIDEADRMLNMGFIPDIKRIFRKTTPKEHRQTCCSAQPLIRMY